MRIILRLAVFFGKTLVDLIELNTLDFNQTLLVSFINFEVKIISLSVHSCNKK